ncbi:MAG: hypothetical protein JWQ96_3030 [Segetibacter sp.]|nr:hypothetical protein [Segetibacter sp.]
MFKFVKCVVVTPSDYNKKDKRLPVVYLLHGYSGNYSDWVKKVPGMQQLADENKLIIVCPDGGFSSWYFDSPVDLTMQYETNVSTEIPRFIDSAYHTINNRTGRAITGLSMGGHGGIFIGYRHAETFGACGSMSGGLDVSAVKNQFEINKKLGDSVVNKSYYDIFSVINIIEKQPAQAVAIIIDCGIEDFFISHNRRTHEKMLSLKIPHDYIERPGKHDWSYWMKALPHQLLYFREYFKNNLQ